MVVLLVIWVIRWAPSLATMLILCVSSTPGATLNIPRMSHQSNTFSSHPAPLLILSSITDTSSRVMCLSQHFSTCRGGWICNSPWNSPFHHLSAENCNSPRDSRRPLNRGPILKRVPPSLLSPRLHISFSHFHPLPFEKCSSFNLVRAV